MDSEQQTPAGSATAAPTIPAAPRPLRARLADKPARRVAVFTLVALALIMSAIDSTIVATALHALRDGLDTSINLAGWTLTGYAFGLTVMLPITGKLGERYGGRRVFIVSVAVFTVTSFLCGLTDNIYLLIVLRMLQAAGGAGFTPSATSIIVDHFGSARDRYVSLFGAMFPIGAMIGPIFGGILVTYWSWRAVFFVNVPIGIAIFALAWPLIPSDGQRLARARQQRSRTDLPGMVLMALCILGIMLAINALAGKSARAGSPAFIAPMGMAVVAGTLFWRHIGRAAQPFLTRRLIAGKGFGVVNVINAVYSGMVIGCIALTPLYATDRYGLSTLQGGTLLVAQGLGQVVFSVLAVAAIRRSGYRRPLYLGGVLTALGILLMALPAPHASSYLWLTACTFLVGCGKGIANPASRNAGLQLAVDHASTIAAIRTLFIQIGSIATVAVITTILADAPDVALTQAWAYVAAAVIFLVALPIIRRVPEHHGAW